MSKISKIYSYIMDIHQLDSSLLDISRQDAIAQVKNIILWEISELLDMESITQKFPSLTSEELFERYIHYLKSIGDPRYQYIASIMEESIEKDIVNTEFGHFVNFTNRFQRLIHIKDSAWSLSDELSDLDMWAVEKIMQALKSFSSKEAFSLLTTKNRPLLENILITSVGINVTLMLGHNLESTRDIVETLYTSLSIWNINGKSVISLWVILPFLAEALLKIKENGFINYLKNNKLDTLLNIAGIVEIGVMVEEYFWVVQNHTALGSLLRSLRILRILRVAQKNQMIKDLIQRMSETLPSMVKIAVSFWGFSVLTTLFFMEVYSKHLQEFSNLTHSFDQMAKLFYLDEAIALTQKMRTAAEVPTITQEISIWWARTYQFISTVFMMWIPPAIFFDVLNKDNRVIQYLSAIWEELKDIKLHLKELKEEIKKQNTNLSKLFKSKKIES